MFQGDLNEVVMVTESVEVKEKNEICLVIKLWRAVGTSPFRPHWSRLLIVTFRALHPDEASKKKKKITITRAAQGSQEAVSKRTIKENLYTFVLDARPHGYMQFVFEPSIHTAAHYVAGFLWQSSDAMTSPVTTMRCSVVYHCCLSASISGLERRRNTDKRNEKSDSGSRASVQQGDVKQPDVVPTVRLKYSLLFEHWPPAL